MKPDDAVRFLTARADGLARCLSTAVPLLPALSEEALLQLARYFDPTRSLVRALFAQARSRGRGTGSVASYLAAGAGADPLRVADSQQPELQDVTEAFLAVLIALSTLRRRLGRDLQQPDLLCPWILDSTAALEYAVKPDRLGLAGAARGAPGAATGGDEAAPALAVPTATDQGVACGEHHGAVVVHGDLWTCKDALPPRAQASPTGAGQVLPRPGAPHLPRCLTWRLGNGSTPHRPTAAPPTTHLCAPRASCCVPRAPRSQRRRPFPGAGGRAQGGRLGHGDIIEQEKRQAPMRVEHLSMFGIVVEGVACGAEHTAVRTDHGLYTFGAGGFGQLGLGDTEQRTAPCVVSELRDQTVLKVACGHYHTFALTPTGLWVWGWGQHGQLGLARCDDVTIPTQVRALDGMKAVQVAGGYCHSAVLLENGQVYTFGSSVFGQLGHGNMSKQTEPRRVEFHTEDPVRLLACGAFQTLTVTHKGTLHVCGRSLHEERGWTGDGKAHRRNRASSKNGTRLAPKPVDLPFSAALM